MGEHSIERTDGSPLTTKAQMELNAVTEASRPPGALSSLSLHDNRRLFDGIDTARGVRRTLFTR